MNKLRYNERGGATAPRGMTLLELLVVIGVMVILMGLALPMMKAGLKGRQVREAARQLSTYVELAKAQAAETGRPTGLMIEVETLPEDANVRFATRLFLAETPLPYAGDVVHAKVTVNGSNVAFSPIGDSLSAGVIDIAPGDLIKIDYKGPLYRIETYNAGGPFTISGSPLPPNGSYSYQIYRQPEKSSSSPLQLATGALVDLSWSGLGLNDITSFDTATGSITIVFEPNGAVTRVLGIGLGTIPPTDTIHLLVGRLDNLVPDDPPAYQNNMQDPECRWVSIGHQTGKVTVAENAVSQTDPPTTPAASVAREFTQSAQSMGGR